MDSNQNDPDLNKVILKKVKFLINLLELNCESPENFDIYLLTKVLFVIRTQKCKDWRHKKLLFNSGVLDHLNQILRINEMATPREAASLCMQMLQNPDDIVLWLKFSSQNLTVNSANTEDIVLKWGEPYKLPPGRGLYRNWGVFFNFGDVIEIPGGVTSPGTLMYKWTISFWMILPLKVFDTQKKHVLVQNIDGEGAYVQIDETMSCLQVVCEQTKKEITCLDISKEMKRKNFKKGWHNFVITCDNQDESGDGRVTAYFNGLLTEKPQSCICFQPIGYVGNSKNGSFPFGTVCDLRVYPYLLKQR